MNKRLFKVELYQDSSIGLDKLHLTLYIVSYTETEASELALKKNNEWNYVSSAYVYSIKVIAEADQYGKPNILLIN